MTLKELEKQIILIHFMKINQIILFIKKGRSEAHGKGISRPKRSKGRFMKHSAPPVVRKSPVVGESLGQQQVVFRKLEKVTPSLCLLQVQVYLANNSFVLRTS